MSGVSGVDLPNCSVEAIVPSQKLKTHSTTNHKVKKTLELCDRKSLYLKTKRLSSCKKQQQQKTTGWMSQLTDSCKSGGQEQTAKQQVL